jgi:hypothetical protein
MKNEIILSSILLLNPVSQVLAQEVSSQRTAVAQTKQYLADMTFESPAIKTGQFWSYDESTKEWVQYSSDYKVRVRFIISRNVETANYTYNGDYQNKVMDYEAIVEKVDPQTGAVLETNENAFFAKRLTKNKFRIYDCNSTSTCWDDSEDYISYADMHVFNTPDGRILKTTKNSKQYFDEDVFEDKILYESTNHYR